ncbi:DgyrCDS6389 [Dimorphilus gyrociliatus]|nr:DgyrCDS6389 [Dimorphilus gyrociliatus]
MCGRRRLVKLLLKSGADPQLVNKNAKKPFDVAKSEKVKKLLEGGDVESSDEDDKDDDNQQPERITLKLKQQIVTTSSSDSTTYRLVSSVAPSVAPATFSDISDEEDEDESNLRAAIDATTTKRSPSPGDGEKKEEEPLALPLTPGQPVAVKQEVEEEKTEPVQIKQELPDEVEESADVKKEIDDQAIKREIKEEPEEQEPKVPPIKIFRENSKGSKKTSEEDVSYVVRSSEASTSMDTTGTAITSRKEDIVLSKDPQTVEERRITRSAFRSQQQKEQKEQNKDDDDDKEKQIREQEEDSNQSGHSTETIRRKPARPKTPPCYKSSYDLHNEIRKQMDERWMSMNLSRARPRAPHAFNRYLSVTCDYVLEGKPRNFESSVKHDLPDNLKKIWQEQEKERIQLRMEHQVERDRLRLCMEQAVLRVHGRASRTNQADTINVCTILKDRETYTMNRFATPVTTGKGRFAGRRQFVQWLQDIDDIFEKRKEQMIARQKHEADALYAVQQLDWPPNTNISLPKVNVVSSFALLPT